MNTFAARFAEELETATKRSPSWAMEDWIATGRASKDYPNGNDGAWWLDNGPKMVDAYADWRDRTGWDVWTTPKGDPAIELEGIITLPLGVRVKGFVDRVFQLDDGSLVVCDIKSGAKTPDSTAQLGIYATLVEYLYGVRPRWGTFWMARKGEHTPLASLNRWSPNVLGSMFKGFVSQVERAREDNIFLPKPSGFCKSCTVAKFCFITGGEEPTDPLSTVDEQDLAPY